MTTSVVWRRRAGSTQVVHAFATNACVDVPICGACFGTAPRFVEVPPPPADLGPYRRCRTCLSIAGGWG